MAIDTNTWLDASKLFVQEHEQAKQLLARQGAELKQLRADLDAAQKAQQTAQELVERTKAGVIGVEHRNAELMAENKRLASEAREACRRCESMESHPDVREAKAARARVEAAKLLAEAERLNPTEKGE